MTPPTADDTVRTNPLSESTVRLTPQVTAQLAGLTDTGRRREHNEDQFLVAELRHALAVLHSSLDPEQPMSDPLGLLLAVADGMGGHEHGDRASAIAAQTLLRHVRELMPWYFRQVTEREAELVEELTAALTRARQRVEAAGRGARKPMGTTLTMAYVLWPLAYVVHVGDSRCYLYRKGELRQVSQDHTLQQALADRGMPTKGFGHVLVRALGGGCDSAEPDVLRLSLAPHDELLLCSDGLNAVVDDDAIAATLAAGGDAQATCARLIGLANDAGGPDNVTVTLARFTPSGDGDRLSRGSDRPDEGRRRPTVVELRRGEEPPAE